MTARYELLIKSMQATAEAVLLMFLLAVFLLLMRTAIRRTVDTPVLPVLFRRLIYNVADVLFLLPIYALILISK